MGARPENGGLPISRIEELTYWRAWFFCKRAASLRPFALEPPRYKVRRPKRPLFADSSGVGEPNERNRPRFPHEVVIVPKEIPGCPEAAADRAGARRKHR